MITSEAAVIPAVQITAPSRRAPRRAAVRAGTPLGLPFDGTWYNVYGSPAAGEPVNYGAIPLSIQQTTGFTTGELSTGAWSFAVRAASANGEERNTDCAVTITISASDTDISSVPAPPVGLRAIATAGGGIRVEWHYPATSGPTAPTGFYVYCTAGTEVDYTTSAATVSYPAPFAAYVANLTGLTGGTSYAIGVRAYNAVGTETNTYSVTVTADAAGPDAVSSLTVTAV